MFCSRAALIHNEGINAGGIYRINLNICIANELALADEAKLCRAAQRGLRNVDISLLANRVWDLKDLINPLMSDPAAHKNLFVWTYLLEDMDTHNCSMQQLNKGMSIAPPILKVTRPGQ